MTITLFKIIQGHRF